MSHVELSSSALERLAARRTFPLHRRTGVCRSLFGPVDHDELSREVTARLREISERDRQRWNFNFEAGTPLDGDYAWETVAEGSSPAFYRESVQGGRTRVPSTPVKPSPRAEVIGAEALERLAAPESGGDTDAPRVTTEVNQENRTDAANSGKTGGPAALGTTRKRTALIPDFFVKRRRCTDRKTTDSSPCHLSTSPPITAEQTPRKRIR